MATVSSRVILLNERPLPGPLDVDRVFRLSTEDVPTTPAEGHIIVKVIYLSVDPAMRGWMSDRKSYVPPVPVGDVMRALGGGVVTASAAPAIPVGSLVTGAFGFREYAHCPAASVHVIPPGVTLQQALGPLGMTGLTAYFGLLHIGEPKAGETVVVSGAAGATGSIAGQIARARGCRVIGIAGSDEKCRWLTDELGFDVAINYRHGNVARALAEATPKGIDVYFDNVGGEILQAALNRMNKFGRVVVCGAIAQYEDDPTKSGGLNHLNIIAMRIKMQGFIVFDFEDKYPEGQRELAELLKQGKLRYNITVVDGFENCGNAVAMLFKGDNTGKLLVKVADEPTDTPRL